MSDPNRPLHVVQVGFDDTLFMSGAPSDTLVRQLNYGGELDRRAPGSRLSIIALTNLKDARPVETGNVVIVPTVATRWQRPTKLYRQLRTLHRDRSIDAIATQTVHLDAWVALLFGRQQRVNVIGQVHYDLFSPIAQRDVFGSGLRGRAYYALCLKMLRYLFAVRVVGQRVREEILSRGLHHNVQVIPVPVTMASNSAGDMAATPCDRVLFVGRLVYVKNLVAWLQVARQIADRAPEVEFEIVGDGPLREALQAEVWQLGLQDRVHFAGAVPYEELAAIYRSAKVFLLTSHYEGFGRVIAEAYLNRVPVVATRIPGVEDIVDDRETGFLHPPGELTRMADSVLQLLRDDALHDRMGNLGRTRVTARFDPERLTGEWVGLLIAASQGRCA